MPPIRSGSTSGRLCRNVDRGVDVALALPAEDVRIALALALAAAVEEQDAVAVVGEHPRALCEPARPGNEITAAPFFDSMYQPFSRRPSLVVNSTSSYGAPRSAAGTYARAACVTT